MGGSVGPGAYFAPTFWQEKGAFLKLPRSTSASGYKHYECYVIMPQSNLGQGYWECLQVGGTHTKDTGEKENKYCSIPAAGFSPVFVPIVAG